MVATYNYKHFAEVASKVYVECALAGSTIFKHGARPDNCYVIMSGNCRALVKYTYLKSGEPKRKTKVLSEMGRRTLFGELSLLFIEKRTATVIATEPTVLLVIPGVTFRRCMKGAVLQKINSLMDYFKSIKYM
jgi:CRP-like cAMP-binding protein